MSHGPTHGHGAEVAFDHWEPAGSPAGEALDVVRPDQPPGPVVLASPHSGRAYPADFVSDSPLDLSALRKSEDAYVDEIWVRAVDAGAPLLKALFPRAYLDVNREPYELDPDMFSEPLPSFVNTRSLRVQAGLGTIARLVTSGNEIYPAKLRFRDAQARISTLYRPYHRLLRRLVQEAQVHHGYAVLIDCHSMPSGALASRGGRAVIDMVLGDCHGTACAPEITDALESRLAQFGYGVERNMPYAGGFTTRHYGAPERGLHAVQVEINRALYMDEASFRRSAGLERLATQMPALVRAVAAIPPERLRPA